MLHLLFQSPVREAVLARVATGDDVVFMGKAVLGLLQKGILNAALCRVSDTAGLFVLGEHLDIHGIATEDLISGIVVINYAGLVELTVKHPVIHSWT